VAEFSQEQAVREGLELQRLCGFQIVRAKAVALVVAVAEIMGQQAKAVVAL
jgi:hypothetical protein